MIQNLTLILPDTVSPQVEAFLKGLKTRFFNILLRTHSLSHGLRNIFEPLLLDQSEQPQINSFHRSRSLVYKAGQNLDRRSAGLNLFVGIFRREDNSNNDGNGENPSNSLLDSDYQLSVPSALIYHAP